MEKMRVMAEAIMGLVNPYPGISMNSMPFRIFRNVKKNKRAAAKRRNVLRARARQKY